MISDTLPCAGDRWAPPLAPPSVAALPGDRAERAAAAAAAAAAVVHVYAQELHGYTQQVVVKVVVRVHAVARRLL